MMTLVGTSGSLSLFSNGVKAAIVDSNLHLVETVGRHEELLALRNWETSSTQSDEALSSLAAAAIKYLEPPVVASAERMYTIPGGVQAEAKKALRWRKEFKRGGTPVGLNSARTLAKGGQIGIQKIRHVAKYFPRHEVDKKGKGWKPSQENYPSNGRIAWSLWGGDAGQRWASAIVEREDKKALLAGGVYSNQVEQSQIDLIVDPPYATDVNAFKMAHELDPFVGPEFMARVRLDGTGIDRLYKIDIDGTVCVWDDCGWDTLGHVDGDVYSYDRALDPPYDNTEKDHVLVDPSSAIIISAFLQERPFRPVTIDEIDPEESRLVSAGMEEEDLGMIDMVLLAAGDDLTEITDGDGNYTPEERAQNASKQVRDATGRFATVGQRVAVGGDTERGAGTVTKLDAKNGLIDVKLDSGKTVTIASKYSQPLKSQERRGNAVRVSNNENAPLDMSGIVGEPRTPISKPKAHLPGTLPPLSDRELKTMLDDWDRYVKDMRNSYKPSSAADKARAKKEWGLKKFAGENSIVAAAEAEKQLTPETSDVGAKYLAVVSPDDKSAVMDLIALVPKTTTTTTPVLYERVDGKWVANEQILTDLKSATPPPVVELEDKAIVDEVLKQVDGIAEVTASAALTKFWKDSIEPVLAAGGLDRNRGNAEALRRYWTKGKGAAKIRWGTPGDWTRCVRNLSKYMGPRAKGYCQLRHKEATGVYTGSKFNPGVRGSSNSSMFASLEEFDHKVLEQSKLVARANEAREKFSLTAGGSYENRDGSKFTIPLLIPEELESGDGRKFKKDSISVRELPLPLLWQIKTGDGHAGSVVVGRIDYVERTEQGMGNAYGVFDSGVYGREAERLVRNGFLRGVSADLDQFEAKEDKKVKSTEASELEDDGEIGKDKLTVNRARVMAATIVAKPAFQECTISIDDSGDQEESMTTLDGVYEETGVSSIEPILASGFLDTAIPVVPPQEWFEAPQLTKPTPLTVDPNGRIYGHIAAWHVNHIGMPRSTRPPRSRSKYAYFHTGVVRTDAGKDIPVGQLTLAGGHANLHASAAQAAKHYDDTASAIADVCAGEDEYGIYVCGSLRPDATEMQIRALRASAPSGDWRPINGSLELVAVCQVNVPGFPIARALVASGKVMALVAAGANFMAMLKSEHVEHFVSKAEQLAQLSASAPNLRKRVREAKKSARTYAVTAAGRKVDELRERALVAAAITELAKFSDEEREKLAEKGFALPDGSYPIRNEDDLRNAIRAYGRSKPQDRVKVRKHITRRARALRKEYLIPQEWQSASSLEASDALSRMRASITAAAVASEARPEAPAEETDPSYLSILASMSSNSTAEFAEGDEISDADLEELKEAKKEADEQTEDEIQQAEDVRAGKTTVEDKFDEEGRTRYTPKTQPRDAKGKYRKVLARLRQNLGVAGLQRALTKAQEAQNLEFAGNYADSAAASSDLIGLIDRLDTGALNPRALENVRLTAAELGKTIANLPLPFGKDAEKVRFSDLPAGLKDLIDSMITRVEAKIGKEDSDVATQSLKSYMSGADVYSQGEVQSEMSKLLRLLT
jgi:hypothetical protein